ncbi:MAG: transaldolase family protein, partial [Leucobacter sp.]
MNASPTAALSAAGVSIWLDDLSRQRIESGELSALIAERDVVGVTTNPTIFAAAIGGGVGYGDRIEACAARGLGTDATIIELTTADVADACDIFAEVFSSSGGRDGRVSIEVEPGLARDAAGTVAQARELWAKVARPNAMIKIPATVEGLEAIAATIAEGISVNVTLIFSLERYRQVINAYLTGLER